MRPFPLFLSVAAALTLRPHSTLGEARFESSNNNNNNNNDCPFYGCPLTPQDVHYNTEKIKIAFEQLRQVKRHQVASSNEALGHGHLAGHEELLKTSGNQDSVTLTLIGYKGGSLQEQINQDRAFIVKPFLIPGEETGPEPRVLLGVFDGHAPRGEMVSDYAVNELPNLLSKKLSEVASLTVDKVKQILVETFVELDTNAPAEESGGCTASVVFRNDTKIYIANAGDSRSFIVTYRPSIKKTRVVYVSREDKPDLPGERARVEAAGGQVYIPARGTSRVVYHDPRTGSPSGLAMSRSIGDWAAGKLGVIPDPIVDVIDIPTLIQAEMKQTYDQDGANYLYIDEQGDVASNSFGSTDMPEDDDVYIFAVSATDGLMDYLDSLDIARVLAKALYEDEGAHPITAAEHLVFAAANGWQQDKQGRYRDDIAIAVTSLHRPASQKENKDPSEL
jgi:serine/threonine protein phosphatase PrpC